MRLSSLLAGVATILVLAMPATAQPQPQQPAAPSGIGAILDYAEALGLSDAQTEALDRLGLDLSREMIRRQADLAIAGLDLDALLDVDPTKTVDVAAAEAKVREIERTRADLQLAVIRTMERAKALLTPEQRARLAKLPDGRRPASSRPGIRPAPFGPAR